MKPCKYCDNNDPELKGIRHWVQQSGFLSSSKLVTVGYHVKCPQCHAKGPNARLSKDAISMWNGKSKWVKSKKKG